MWNTFNWSKIVFSNETKIELHSKKREFVRRPKGKRRDPIMLQKQQSLEDIKIDDFRKLI